MEYICRPKILSTSSNGRSRYNSQQYVHIESLLDPKIIHHPMGDVAIICIFGDSSQFPPVVMKVIHSTSDAKYNGYSDLSRVIDFLPFVNISPSDSIYYLVVIM